MFVPIDYFTKWIKGVSYAKITSKHVAKFLINNVICRYNVPRELIRDQGSHFRMEIAALLEKDKIQHHISLSSLDK